MAMAIYVKNEDYHLRKYGNVIDQHIQNVINLRPTDTVGSLIRKIKTVYSISGEEMKRRILFHRSSKRDLIGEVKSSATLEQCGVKEFDSLELGFRVPMVVEVTMSNGTSKDMKVSPFDTYGEVKRRAKETSKGPRDDRTLISTGIFKKTYSKLDPGIGINIDDDSRSKCVVVIAGSSIFFTIFCEPNDKVRDVRERIRKMSNDPSNKELYRLSLIKESLFVIQDDQSGSVLDDDTPMGSSHCLRVLPSSPMTISVSIPETGECYDIENVKCYWTIPMLKERIFGLTGIPPPNQCLSHKECSLDFGPLWSEVCNDPFGVHSKGIKETISIQVNTVEDSDDEVPEEEARRRKRRLRRLGNDDEQFQVCIEIPTVPVCFPLKLVSSDNIGDMRKDIQCLIKEGLFVLFYHGKQLEDDSITLNQLGIKNADTVHVLEKGYFEICVKMLEDAVVHVRVESFETVGLLKEKLQVLTGIPVELQRLLYRDWFLDDDERFLGDHGIATGSIIPRVQYDESFSEDLAIAAGHAIPRVLMKGKKLFGDYKKEFSVFLFASEDARVTKARTFYPKLPLNCSTTVLQVAIEIPSMPWRLPLICSPMETIAGVRRAIRENSYVEHEELFGQRYIEEGRFVLAFNRNRLLDEAMTLEDCGIRHMDSIQLLEDNYFPIYLHVYERALFTRLDVKCFDTIRELKEVIASMSGIPPSMQHLYCSQGRWWLEDDEKENRRLVDYGIARRVRYESSSRNSRNPRSRDRCKDDISLYVSSSRHNVHI